MLKITFDDQLSLASFAYDAAVKGATKKEREQRIRAEIVRRFPQATEIEVTTLVMEYLAMYNSYC